MKAFLHAIAAFCMLLLLLAACARPRGSGHGPFLGLDPSRSGTDTQGAAKEVFQTGIASWYGEDFHGRATADGEIYDMHKLTAAHQELPFHTLVEVENLENSRKILVRVNDRGPFLKERIIDLSFEAARRLGMADKGTAEVSLRVRRWGGHTITRENFPGTPRGFFVQAGAFLLRENAEDLLLTLGDILPGLAFRIAEEDGLFKVISLNLNSAAASRDVLQNLAQYRLQGFVRESDAPLAE